MIGRTIIVLEGEARKTTRKASAPTKLNMVAAGHHLTLSTLSRGICAQDLTHQPQQTDGPDIYHVLSPCLHFFCKAAGLTERPDDRPFCCFLRQTKQSMRAFKFRKLLSKMVEVIRIVRRWTPTTVFRLYTSLELSAEAARQATRLWGDGIKVEPALASDVAGAWDRGWLWMYTILPVLSCFSSYLRSTVS